LQQVLLRRKPNKEQTDEKWKEEWESSYVTLEPLYLAILDLVPAPKIKGTDFDTPNHYAKLAWEQGQRDFAEKILSLFPKKLTTK
jgi:hypothetical protein